MTHIFKFLAVVVLMITVTACGEMQYENEPFSKSGQFKKKYKHQPATKTDLPEKKHNIYVSFNIDTESIVDKRISGFRLYKEGKLICETRDPKSTSIDCDFSTQGGSFLFTMTTYFEDGSESMHSKPFAFTVPD